MLLRELSRRVPLVHLKGKLNGTPLLYKESVDRSAFKEVGHGSLDWKTILRAAASAGVEHYFVEQDQTRGEPVESLQESFGFLSKLEY